MQVGPIDLDGQVMIVAEIGSNHEGSVARAEEMIARAAEAGADAVKFQTIVPERLVSAAQVDRVEQLERFQLSRADFTRLAHVARTCDIVFLSTPFDVDSVQFLNDLVPAFKIASSDNTFIALLETVARTGKPILLSAGLAELAELRQAKGCIEHVWQQAGCRGELAVLHCVSCYPTPPERVNLRSISFLRDHLGVTVGYSDHTLDIEACVLAVGLGARIVEKHFTLDKDYSEFRDHRLSADPGELRRLVGRIREAERMLGEYGKRVDEVERPGAAAWRRSVVAGRDLPAGHVLSLADLDWVRPGGGLPPGREGELVGRMLRCSKRRGEMIRVADTQAAEPAFARGEQG